MNLGAGPDGWDVARKVRELVAGLPVVYISAAANHEWTARGVMIVEDEFLIATDVAEVFEREGAHVLGPVSSVKKAMSLLEAAPAIDCGILDLNLGGELVYPVADKLADHVPFLFTTGYDERDIPHRFEHIMRLEKPADGASTVKKVKQLLAGEI